MSNTMLVYQSTVTQLSSGGRSMSNCMLVYQSTSNSTVIRRPVNE